MPKIWHDKLQQGSSPDVPSPTKAQKTQTARPQTSVPLAKQQNMFQSRSRPCFKHAMRNTTTTQLKCATPHLMADNDGILKARCISEIWHHKPHRTICLGVPFRSTSILDRNLKDWRTTTLRACQRSSRLESSVASRSGSNA